MNETRFLGRGIRKLISLAVAASVAVACESTGPTIPLAGTYIATTFVVTETGQAPVDVLAAGGSMAITITENNTTSGSLVIPAALTGSSDFLIDLTGTVNRNGNAVQFDQTGDSFVRDATWALQGNTLATHFLSSAVSVDVVLTRQ